MKINVLQILSYILSEQNILFLFYHFPDVKVELWMEKIEIGNVAMDLDLES